MGTPSDSEMQYIPPSLLASQTLAVVMCILGSLLTEDGSAPSGTITISKEKHLDIQNSYEWAISEEPPVIRIDFTRKPQ